MRRQRRLSKATLIAPLALILLAPGCTARSTTFSDGVIEGGQIAALRSERPIVLIDVRDEPVYNAGHVAGAVHVDAKQWKTDSLTDAADLTHVAFWRDRIGETGVSGATPVVIYDDGRMTEAARVWFILQHFGVGDVAVLDGGYPSLQPQIENGAIAVSTTPTRAEAVEFWPEHGHGGDVGLANRKQVTAALDNPRVQIFDTRTAGEYAGTNLRRNPRGGHIPRAVNLPHKDLLNADGRLKSREELAKIFKDAGFRKDRPIITHCQSGGRASLAALAAERAGYRHVMNYYESFGKWSADAGCPVETPKP